MPKITISDFHKPRLVHEQMATRDGDSRCDTKPALDLLDKHPRRSEVRLAKVRSVTIYNNGMIYDVTTYLRIPLAILKSSCWHPSQPKLLPIRM